MFARLHLLPILADAAGSGHFAGIARRLATRAAVAARTGTTHGLCRVGHSRNVSSRVVVLRRAISRPWFAQHFAAQRCCTRRRSRRNLVIIGRLLEQPNASFEYDDDAYKRYMGTLLHSRCLFAIIIAFHVDEPSIRRETHALPFFGAVYIEPRRRAEKKRRRVDGDFTVFLYIHTHLYIIKTRANFALFTFNYQ
jgi:hypothetical protein